MNHINLVEDVVTTARKTLEETLLEIDSTKIVAIYLTGSLIRGDFVSGISDFDFFIVYDANANEPVWEEKSFQVIKQALTDDLAQFSVKNKLFRDVDICTITTGEIAQAAKYPEKFSFSGPRKNLGIYAFDLTQNSMLLIGEDIFKEIVVRDPKQFIADRFSILYKNFMSILENETLAYDIREFKLLIHLGEFVRLLCIATGVKSLHKKAIFDCFDRQVCEFPMKAEIKMILENYSQGVSSKKTLEHFPSFDDFAKDAVEQIVKVWKTIV